MKSFTFSHAITRKPSGSIVAGLRAVDTGTPDLGLMLAHHADYIVALRSTGATVVELDAAEAFPDSVFVEDTALCLPKGAVVMRPGAPTRLGEAALMEPNLRALYGQVLRLGGAEGYMEGGVFRVTEPGVVVGRPPPPSGAGVAKLARLIA